MNQTRDHNLSMKLKLVMLKTVMIVNVKAISDGDSRGI